MPREVQPTLSRRGFDVMTGRFRLSGVQSMRYEPTPWVYHSSDRRYARDWPYTCLTFVGGFMMRVYDWEGRPRRV